jgi:hypothetical protein
MESVNLDIQEWSVGPFLFSFYSLSSCNIIVTIFYGYLMNELICILYCLFFICKAVRYESKRNQRRVC